MVLIYGGVELGGSTVMEGPLWLSGHSVHWNWIGEPAATVAEIAAGVAPMLQTMSREVTSSTGPLPALGKAQVMR